MALAFLPVAKCSTLSGIEQTEPDCFTEVKAVYFNNPALRADASIAA